MHPLFLKIKYNSTVENNSFMVMPFYKRTLKSFIDDKNNIITINQKEKIVKSIILGLAAIHAQAITHNDIKPDNILLDIQTSSDGSNNITINPIITDFSLAIMMNGYQPRNRNIQTLNFKPPESLYFDIKVIIVPDDITDPILKQMLDEGQEITDPDLKQLLDDIIGKKEIELQNSKNNIKFNYYAGDIWSLGLTIAYIANAKYLFDGDTIIDLIESIEENINKLETLISRESKLLYNLCMKTIEYYQKDRSSVKELIEFINEKHDNIITGNYNDLIVRNGNKITTGVDIDSYKRKNTFSKPIYNFTESQLINRKYMYEWLVSVSCDFNIDHYTLITSLVFSDVIYKNNNKNHEKMQLDVISILYIVNTILCFSSFELENMHNKFLKDFTLDEFKTNIEWFTTIIGNYIVECNPIYSEYVDYFRKKENIKKFIILYCSELGAELNIDDLILLTRNDNYLKNVENIPWQVTDELRKKSFEKWLDWCESEYLNNEYLTPFEIE